MGAEYDNPVTSSWFPLFSLFTEPSPSYDLRRPAVTAEISCSEACHPLGLARGVAYTEIDGGHS